jgi:uncharacterized protein (DUF1800 family)
MRTMPRSKARALPILVLGLAALAVHAPAQAFRFGPAEAEHLLNRAGFGGTPEQIASLVAMGPEKAVDQLLEATALGSDSGLPVFLPEDTKARPDPEVMRAMTDDERKKFQQEMRRKDQAQLFQFRNWWIDRMINTTAPVEEKMTLFWAGHFTSSQRDVKDSAHMIQQNQTLRDQALGNFRLMLHAIARDPAMLEYLSASKNRKNAPNENFAREVMELFTLGLGNYTEEDIREAARAFTGWGYVGDRFVLNDKQHDSGDKTVLGSTGKWDGGDVLDILLAQPAAPRFVASRILGFFVTPHPPEAMVARYAALLRQHEWNVKPVMRALFLDPDFYAPEHMFSRILGPVEYAVSIARKLPCTQKPPAFMIAMACDRLGQSLLAPPNVKGWEGGEAWITTSTLLERGNLAQALVDGLDVDEMRGRFGGERLPGFGFMDRAERPRGWHPKLRLAEFLKQRDASGPKDVVVVLCDHFLSVPVSDEARASLEKFLTDDLAAGEKFSFEGMLAERRLEKLVHLILSLPEAQLG